MSTQPANYEESRYWSIMVEYEEENDLKILLKKLELPLKNKKEKERVEEHLPRRVEPKEKVLKL